jgi:septum formation protein
MLYLASTSPRRTELLTAAGISHVVIEPGPEAAPKKGESPAQVARKRAASKAHGAQPPGRPGWVLGVDTVVACGGVVYGKPDDAADARRILLALAAAGSHEVHTALCLRPHPARRRLAVEGAALSIVRCAAMTHEQLEAYLAGGSWRGKAGAYGLQDEGGRFMALVDGDRDTVIGLPVRRLRALLAQAEALG